MFQFRMYKAAFLRLSSLPFHSPSSLPQSLYGQTDGRSVNQVTNKRNSPKYEALHQAAKEPLRIMRNISAKNEFCYMFDHAFFPINF